MIVDNAAMALLVIASRALRARERSPEFHQAWEV